MARMLFGYVINVPISSSSCPGVGTPWSEEWHQCFMPACDADISDTLGMEAAGAGSPSAMAHNWVVADIPRRAANEMSLVRNYRRYRSVPQFLGGQVCMATPKASTKAWQSHLSTTSIWCSSANTLSL